MNDWRDGEVLGLKCHRAGEVAGEAERWEEELVVEHDCGGLLGSKKGVKDEAGIGGKANE